MSSPLSAARRTIAIGAIAAVTAMLSVTAVALAYHGAHNGIRQAYQTLYVGLGYHNIVRVSNTNFANTLESICAKGERQDGLHKDGGGCNANTNLRESVFPWDTPSSAGYGYFGGAAGTSTRLYVYECTSADVAWCDF
jgi:hypothetical protein